MTKKEWYSLVVGSKVWKKHNDLEWTDGKCVSKEVYLYGSVIRLNSNRSQVLVIWDGRDSDGTWYGRLGIELVN